MNDKLVEWCCAQGAHEVCRAYAQGVGKEVRPWELIGEEQQNAMVRVVRFVLDGGTPERLHEARRAKLRERGAASEAMDVDWERLPATQQKREILMVAAVNALAMALGHSKRPVVLEATLGDSHALPTSIASEDQFIPDR